MGHLHIFNKDIQLMESVLTLASQVMETWDTVLFCSSLFFWKVFMVLYAFYLPKLQSTRKQYFCLCHRANDSLDIMSSSLTSKNCKEEKHNRIEEAKAHGQGVLMDDSGDYEDGEHGSCSEFPFRQLWN